MFPLIAAKAASDDMKKGDKGTIMPAINIVNKQAKTGVYVTVGIIVLVASYYGIRTVVWNVQKKNALKLSEANNAQKIYGTLAPMLRSNFWSYLNPLNFGVTAIKDAANVIVTKVENFITGSSDPKFVDISTVGVYNVDELIHAYHGLYRRDLLADLKSALSDDNYTKLTDHWKQVDMARTGVGFYGGNVSTLTGKKVTTYTFGTNPAYANKYGLVVKNGAGKYVSTTTDGIMKINNITFVKGNYAGYSKGFSIAGQQFNGGLVAKDTNGTAGIYMYNKSGSKDVGNVVPIDSILLFDTIADMNNYANSNKITVTNINV